MSLWSTIAYRLKELLKNMVGSRTIEQTLHVTPAISSEMENAIELWSAMYKGRAPWLKEPVVGDATRIVSLGLPALIASEKARTALLEMQTEITAPVEEVSEPVPEQEIIDPNNTQKNEQKNDVQSKNKFSDEQVSENNLKKENKEQDKQEDTDEEKQVKDNTEEKADIKSKDENEKGGNDFFEKTVEEEKRPITEKAEPINTERAEYLEQQYKKLKKQLRRQIEYGIAKGGLVIKPYVIMNAVEEDKEQDNNSNLGDNNSTSVSTQKSTNTTQTIGAVEESGNKDDQNKNIDNDNSSTAVHIADIEFDFVQADCFYPLAFDASGMITEAAFIQTKIEKDRIYRRLEYHKWENNKVQIINKAFKSNVNSTSLDVLAVDLGHEIPLTDVPEWKDLEATVTIANVTKPLFAYFKMPEANIIDTTSPLGMSGYGRAVQLIKDADMQYSRLLWEYEAGEMAVNIDRDAFMWKTDKYEKNSDRGHSELGVMQQRLYRQLDVSGDELFQPYAPALRDDAYLTGLNAILMRIEDVTGLSRGTLSDASAEARTATELKILKQRSYQTNADIQQAIEDALKDVVYIMNAYCDLYEIVPDGKYDVSFQWDDSIITDVDTELGKRITLMQNGLTSKLENRMWYFGETEQQARDALLQIREEGKEAMEDNMMNMMQMQEEQNNSERRF